MTLENETPPCPAGPQEDCSSGLAGHLRNTELNTETFARLTARRTPPKTGRRHVYLYDVEFDGELVITGSADPACDFARAMRVRGHRGWIKVIDADSGMHRYSVNIEKAARLTVRETAQEGPRFVKWKPLNPGDGSPRTGGRGQS
jgi:hypothetical protein